MSAFSSTVPQLRTTFLPQDVKWSPFSLERNLEVTDTSIGLPIGSYMEIVYVLSPLSLMMDCIKSGCTNAIEANEATAQQSPMPRWCMSAGSGRPKGYKVTGCSTHWNLPSPSVMVGSLEAVRNHVLTSSVVSGLFSKCFPIGVMELKVLPSLRSSILETSVYPCRFHSAIWVVLLPPFSVTSSL